MILGAVAALTTTTLSTAFLAEGKSGTSGVSPPLEAAQSTERPNVVLINTDDLTKQMLAGREWAFPNIHAIKEEGVSFERYFNTNSWCCPSRSTLFTGLYPHNHNVWYVANEDNGGYRRYAKQGFPERDLSVALSNGGVQTGLFGKYLNDLPPGAPKPEGWDTFEAFYTPHPSDPETYPDLKNHSNFIYDDRGDGLDSEGRTHTEVIAGRASAWIEGQEGPFFAYVAPFAPHKPSVHPPEYDEMFTRAQPPGGPSFNEADTSDKPEWQSYPRLSTDRQAEYTERYRDFLRSTKDIDDMVGELRQSLRQSGELDSTYFVFTSDNGYHFGEHRLPEGKRTAYEEDIRAPLFVMGPGVPEGATHNAMVANTDLAPTIAKMMGASLEPWIEPDGRSLAPYLDAAPDNDPAARWRLLIEGAASQRMPWYRAIRTKDYTYVDYGNGEEELYDLGADARQLRNLAGTKPRLEQHLADKLGALRRCRGAGCKEAEIGP